MLWWEACAFKEEKVLFIKKWKPDRILTADDGHHLYIALDWKLLNAIYPKELQLSPKTEEYSRSHRGRGEFFIGQVWGPFSIRLERTSSYLDPNNIVEFEVIDGEWSVSSESC